MALLRLESLSSTVLGVRGSRFLLFRDLIRKKGVRGDGENLLGDASTPLI